MIASGLLQLQQTSAVNRRPHIGQATIRLTAAYFPYPSNWWRTKDGWLMVVQESVQLLYYRNSCCSLRCAAVLAQPSPSAFRSLLSVLGGSRDGAAEEVSCV